MTSASSRLNSSASNPNWVSSFVQPPVNASGKNASTTALWLFQRSLKVTLSPTFSPPRVDQVVKSGALSPTLRGIKRSYAGAPNRLQDVGVGAAAAQVARQVLARLLVGRIGVLGQQRVDREHHARRTPAALVAGRLQEG